MPLDEFIGRYRVERRLGEGGMGTVYLAHDDHIDRYVAIKVMRSDSEELLRRFKVEAKAAGRLKHPNIVTIYDFAVFDGMPCLIMEYVEGETVARLISRHAPLSIERRLELIEQVCRALAFAHRAGIVHRDIKPANLMIDGDGTVKVLDFGIARTTTGSGTTGKVVGTVAYMAPEQALGRPVDLRCDIWALALVLFEFVTGKVAFAGDSDYTVLDRIVRGEPEQLEHRDPEVVKQLQPILSKALAKDPDDRYANAEIMARDLSNARQALEGEARDTKTVILRPSAVAEPKVEAPKDLPLESKPVTDRPSPSPAPPAAPPPAAPAREAVERAAPRRPERAPAPPAVISAATSSPARIVVWAAAGILAVAAGLWSVWPPRPAPAVDPSPSPPSEIQPARIPDPVPAPPPDSAATPAPAPQAAPPASPAASLPKPAETVREAPARPAPVQAGTPAQPTSPAPARKDYSAQIAAARNAFEDGDYAGALRRYDAVLKEDADHVEAQRGMEAVRAAQAAEQSLLGLGRPSATLPIDIKGRLAHARSRFEEGDYDAAITAYEEVLAVDPRNAAAQSGRNEARSARAAEAAILKRPPKKPGA